MTAKLVFRRRLPPPFAAASLFVTPSARLAYAFKSFSKAEPALLQCARSFVGRDQTVWDIGANIGIFSFAAAVMAGPRGKVFAFEPDQRLVTLLRRSAMLRDPLLADVAVVPVAVANEIGLRRFSIASRSSASNALAGYGNSQMGGIVRTDIVPCFSLDWLLRELPPPDLIKIDVEGAEFEVMQGGQSHLLDAVRPIIICEVGVERENAITSIFSNMRYKLYDGDKPFHGGNPVDRATWNTVAVPEEKLAALERLNSPSEPKIEFTGGLRSRI